VRVDRDALRVLGWDHERCLAPLRAAAAVYPELHGRAIEIAVRSLADFGDGPVDVFRDVDVVLIDHPHIGLVVERGLIAPLDELMPGTSVHAVGPSQDSYLLGGHTWALAVDAACQVDAMRDDLLPAGPPAGFAELVELARRHPRIVAMPLHPAHAFCSALALGDGDLASGSAMLETIVPWLHACSFGAEPPDVLARLCESDDLAYVALTFGYSGYSTPGTVAHPCRFVPSVPPARGTLGGVGAAVSSTSADADAAARFAAWLASDAIQREIVLAHGGQPAAASVWDDPAADAACGGFFGATRSAVEVAFVRPRHAGYPEYQRVQGRALVARLCRVRARA
jgi:multiple sugar transport system substrate-binding protein